MKISSVILFAAIVFGVMSSCATPDRKIDEGPAGIRQEYETKYLKEDEVPTPSMTVKKETQSSLADSDCDDTVMQAQDEPRQVELGLAYSLPLRSGDRTLEKNHSKIYSKYHCIKKAD